ncbi:MAG: SixA phosphatase family protein [Myxococcota bacterium]
MELTLIRHAIAEDGDDDFARPLSGRGRKRFTAEVARLETMGVRFERVLHSPLTRAVQTAELLRPLTDGLEETPLLAKAPTRALLEACSGERVALVGHEPHLSALLAWLVLGDAAEGGRFELKKGAVAVLDGAPRPGAMRLIALLTPKALR